MKQDRIEGSYTIVSTCQKGIVEDSMGAVRYAWANGLSVALVVGVWLGDREESLLLTGYNHAQVGRELAHTYNQDAYIVVGDGKASLYVFNGHTYVLGNEWTRQVVRTSEDSYTIAPTGLEFVFAA